MQIIHIKHESVERMVVYFIYSFDVIYVSFVDLNEVTISICQ